MVTLTDSAGKSVTLTSSDFTGAQYNTPGQKSGDMPLKDHPDDARWMEQVPQLLNMVALPLEAFKGVDLGYLKELKLAFPTESGKVAITDMEFQNFGRTKPAATLAQR